MEDVKKVSHQEIVKFEYTSRDAMISHSKYMLDNGWKEGISSWEAKNSDYEYSAEFIITR